MDAVVDGITKRGGLAHVVSVRGLPAGGRITFGPHAALHIDVGGELVDAAACSGIWAWHVERPAAPDGDAATSEYVRREWELAVLGLAARTKFDVWVNHPAASRWLESNKLEQLRLASEVGLLVPPTLLSNDPERIVDFSRSWDSVAVKSQGGVRRERSDGRLETAFTQRCSVGELASARSALARAPVIVQPYLAKSHELRVTVVDETIVACRIDSQASPRTQTDWRRYDFDHVTHDLIELEDPTRQSVLDLVTQAGLRFAAIDLLCTPADETYFLDLNPSGQFRWIEDLTGAPITAALCSALMRKRRSAVSE